MMLEKELMLKKAKSLWLDKRLYKDRLVIAMSAMLAACFTFIFFGPFEMVAFGVDSLMYTWKDIALLLIISAVAVFGVGTALLACLKGKLFNYGVSLVYAVTIAGYLQATFLNADASGSLTGEVVEWYTKRPQMFASMLAWILVFVVVYTILFFHRGMWKNMVIGGSLLLALMQLIPTIGIVAGLFEAAALKPISSYYLSEKGMAEYSSEENIFVFVVDYTDFDYIQNIEQSNPEFFEKYTGFTGYRDAVSVFGRTKPALCNILTGYIDGAYVDDRDAYFQNAWNTEQGNVLDDLIETGYTVELYANTMDLFRDHEDVQHYAANVCEKNGHIVPFTMLKKMMYLSAYRYAPVMMKPFFWAYSDFYNTDVYIHNGSPVYELNDPENAEIMRSATAERSDKVFKFIHFDGAHPPCFLSPDGFPTNVETDETTKAMGSLTLLNGIFNRMKEVGIYEDAAIIITADHGTADKMWDSNFSGIQIGMFYKAPGKSEEPFQWSDAQVSTSNIPATIAKAAKVDYSKYGKALDDILEEETVEREFVRVTEYREITQVKYKILGNAADFSNWETVSDDAVLSSFYW